MMIEAEIAYSVGSNALSKTAGTLLDVAPMLDFAIFTNTKHSAVQVAAMKKNVLAKYGERPTDISLATEDGASNNKKPAKLLHQPFKVCFPHDSQRAVLFSTGMTGKPNQNNELATVIGSLSRMAGAPHRSVKVAGALQAAHFKNNSFLESTLFSANEVSGLVQKQDGMGLSMGYQMAKVLKDEATAMKLMVVSGTTKEGDWKETHVNVLPNMFKVQRRIFAEQLELRFKVDGTPTNTPCWR